MKVISLNANGIRSAVKKGFFDWVKQEAPEILCIQETKAHENQLGDEAYYLEGYERYFSNAQKPGYSGVGMYIKNKILKTSRVIYQLGFDLSDQEGRYIQVDIDDQNLSIVSLYLPSGASGEHRQTEKFNFMKRYEKILASQINSGRSYIICGDWNIVHKEIDIKNFKSNQKNSGCLPEERAWLDQLLSEKNNCWVDAFRVLNSDKDQYTWWSNRGQAWAKNVGWRIDYQIVTPDLKNKIQAVGIYKNQKFSDHAPLWVEYGF